MTEVPRANEAVGPKWISAYEVRPKRSAIQAYIDVSELLKREAVDSPLFFVGVDTIDYLIFTGDDPIRERLWEKVGVVLKRYQARVSNIDRHPIIEAYLDSRYRQYRETKNPFSLSFSYIS